MDEWTISRLGDGAVVAACGERIDPAINERVLRVAHVVRELNIPGVRDVVESYCAVTLYFDPLRTDLPVLWSGVEHATSTVGGEDGPESPAPGSPREVTVPVCYGGRFGPDLADVARHAGLDEAEVVRRHAGECYRVYMLGFLPGFAYMGLVPKELAVPRRSTPRLRVPEGAVGIADRQTGVYPLAAPGGWQLIGRTPITVFDARREDPFLFRAGDRVRFKPVDEHAFQRLRHGVAERE